MSHLSLSSSQLLGTPYPDELNWCWLIGIDLAASNSGWLVYFVKTLDIGSGGYFILSKNSEFLCCVNSLFISATCCWSSLFTFWKLSYSSLVSKSLSYDTFTLFKSEICPSNVFTSCSLCYRSCLSSTTSEALYYCLISMMRSSSSSILMRSFYWLSMLWSW